MKLERFAPLRPEDVAYLLDQVRSFEPDWLLALPYVTDAVRPAWLAVLAFAAETIGAPARVSNGMLGRIRQEWRREALDEVFGPAAARQHPVVRALAETLPARNDAGRLRGSLENMLDGLDPFFAPGEDADLAAAMATRRPIYSSLASALDHLMVEEGGGEGLLLHALCRTGPALEAAPKEDGTEAPSLRFARALAREPQLEQQLAEALNAYRRGGKVAISALPLRLFTVRDGRVVRRRNPFAQRMSVFLGALGGR